MAELLLFWLTSTPVGAIVSSGAKNISMIRSLMNHEHTKDLFIYLYKGLFLYYMAYANEKAVGQRFL